MFQGNFNDGPPLMGVSNTDLYDSFHFYNSMILGTCLIKKEKTKFRNMIPEDYHRDWFLIIQYKFKI